MSPASWRRAGLPVAARSAASTCGVNCAHRGQVAGFGMSPGLLAAGIASAYLRVAAAWAGVSRSRRMAWVSRCICSPR